MTDFSGYKHIIPHIALGAGVIGSVAGWAASQGYGRVLTVCDPVTRRVAGERVAGMLKDAGIDVTEFCFDENEPLPDEYSVGRVLAAYTPDIDLIFGVGSGTINDICTFAGARIGCPSAIAGTAPSMDGYASLGSAMLFGGVKITPPTQCPAAIFCDTDILAEAPMNMIAAGLGDMLGKITSLADWRLSHIMTGEAMPDDIYSIMANALDKVIRAAPLAAVRDKAAIESITEGLILSGIAMSLYGDSRPASGTEHHLAHFWELRTRKHELHGIKVGLGTVIALALWKVLLRKPSEGDDEIDSRITDIAKSLPGPGEVAGMLSAAGMSVSPKALGLSSSDIYEGVLYAKNRKPTYTLLQYLSSRDLLDEYAGIAVDYFAKSALDGVKCFVLDMDGTIYLGSRLFPYTLDFLAFLEERGMDYVFFTNNSSQNAAYYVNKLRSMGINVDGSRLLMSTHVLLDYLSNMTALNVTVPGSSLSSMAQCPAAPHPCSASGNNVKQSYRTVFVAGTRALMDDFEAAGYALTDDIPDFAVLGFDTDMDYPRLSKLCDFVRAGVPLYGVNMDYNCPVERTAAGGGFIPDCGALAAAVHASTGVCPEFFGKPSRRALDYIIKKTGYREEELCFAGDRLYTDIAIADGTKARSVLVLSGETKREDLAGSEFIPDLVVEDLRELMVRGL